MRSGDIQSCTPEEFECLWLKSRNLTRAGAIMTAVGTTSLIAGMLALDDDSMDLTGNVFIGGLGTARGILLNGIGIPAWITGATRKSRLRHVEDNRRQSPGSLMISPCLQENHSTRTFCPGLGP